MEMVVGVCGAGGMGERGGCDDDEMVVGGGQKGGDWSTKRSGEVKMDAVRGMRER